jgi:diguanylate cyclase (GGDEF)-like protein
MRRATEESQQFLADLPAWLASSFARANPVWRREMLLRKSIAGASVNNQSVVLEGITQLEALATQEHMPVAFAYALLRRTRIESVSGNYQNAMSYMTQAMGIINQIGDRALAGMGNTEFCGLYYRMEQINQAMKYCQLATIQLQGGVDEYSLGRAENFISILLGEQKKDDASIAMAQSARGRFIALGMFSTATMIDDNVGDIYLRRGQPEKALALSEAALKLELATGRTGFAVTSRRNIALILSGMQRHREALASIAAAIAQAKSAKLNSFLPEFYQTQMEVAIAANQLRLAVGAARNCIEVSTAQSNEKASRELADLEARYKATEQKREIERLDQQRVVRNLELDRAREKDRRQTEQLRRQRLWLWLVAVTMGALVLVCALMYALWQASRRHGAKMRVLANTDGLTDVLNRRAIMEQIQNVFDRRLEEGSDACLCIVDADHFKLINDSYGHQAGDAALQRIAKILSTSLPKGASLGRIGGEEFAVLLAGHNADQGFAQAERFRKLVADFTLHGEVVHFAMAVSIGVAPLWSSITDSARWFAQADRAMYEAKAQGRNRSVVAQSEQA